MKLWKIPTLRSQRQRRRQMRLTVPTLRFTPYAWAKLLYLRDAGSTEVGGFGISASDDLLLVEDFCLVNQRSSLASVAFADAAVADYFDAQVDRGLRPEQFGRIWIHTHPGSSPLPSGTDETTFARSFAAADWAVMFILARGGRSYARLRLGIGPRAELLLPVSVDFQRLFPAPDEPAWASDYQQCVTALDEWPDLRNRAPRRAEPATPKPTATPHSQGAP